MKRIGMLLMLTVLWATFAQAQTFQNIQDAIPGARLAAELSTQTETTLTFGMNTGFSPTSLTYLGMAASTAAFYSRFAVDMMLFTIVAPPDKTIAFITYAQYGSAFVSRLSGVEGTVALTVDRQPFIRAFTSTPSLTQVIDLRGQGFSSVEMTAYIQLFAFGQYTATIALSQVAVTVEFE